MHQQRPIPPLSPLNSPLRPLVIRSRPLAGPEARGACCRDTLAKQDLDQLAETVNKHFAPEVKCFRLLCTVYARNEILGLFQWHRLGIPDSRGRDQGLEILSDADNASIFDAKEKLDIRFIVAESWALISRRFL